MNKMKTIGYNESELMDLIKQFYYDYKNEYSRAHEQLTRERCAFYKKGFLNYLDVLEMNEIEPFYIMKFRRVLLMLVTSFIGL